MKQGLTDKEAEINRNKYGSNELPDMKHRSLINIIIESLGDPIIKILLIALAIKVFFMFKDFNWYETLGILIAIFLATLISTLSEYGSESAFKKMQEENKEIICKVFRNNTLSNIKSSQIVVNDLLCLETGDIIPADGKIVGGELEIDESILTGESKAQIKNTKKSNVYKGTVIVGGEAKVIVESVGISTVYGNIAKEVGESKNKSPLKIRLLKLSKIINRIGYIGAALVVVSYLFSVVIIKNNFNFDLIKIYIFSKSFINDLIYALTLCVTTIVVAVPEGLPMMITLVLSSNMKRLVKDNVLVRKMVGIETAGNLTFLLTDKTGTITEGKLKVISYVSGDLIKYNDISKLNSKYKEEVIKSLIYNLSSSISDKEIIGGNSTDKAIINFIKDENLEKKYNYEFKPFNSSSKYSEAYVDHHHYIKGAFDILIDKCDYILDHSGNIRKINKKLIYGYINEITKKGSRVLANIDIHNNKTILVGIIIIKDVIRKESYEGIENIKKAKINVIMITGDNKNTASSIAREVGIIKNSSDLVIDSNQLNKLSDEEVYKRINDIKVISRALPTDKSRLVRILQNSGQVVGMTGDGVNDAPALKKADVGFAMGSGTSVAKEASDIVILDNNLLSISKAILFGRTIFKSIRKFIVYQLSVNFCALTLSIIGPFIGINTPITITQMLWLNMIMDTFAGLAFSFEPSLKKYLEENPINKSEPVINYKMYIEIVTDGLYSAFLCVLFLKAPFIKTLINGTTTYFMTAYFALFIFLGIFNAFCSRTEHINIFKDIIKNKQFLIIFSFISLAQIFIIYYGGNIFGTYGLKINDLLFVIVLASSTVFVNTIRKVVVNKKRLVFN